MIKQMIQKIKEAWGTWTEEDELKDRLGYDVKGVKYSYLEYKEELK